MKRQLLVFALVAGVVFGMGYLVFQCAVMDKPAKAPPPRPVQAASTKPPHPHPEPVRDVTVVSTSGQVERRGFQEQAWRPVSAGDHLGIEESIKTAKGSGAKLRVDRKSEIELTARSELSVREISETVHRFRLVRGKLGADYDETGQRILKIESAHSDAVAVASSGKFVIQNSGGIVSVATTEGEVRLTARNKTVTIADGETSHASPGEQPSAPRAIPLSVMLRVAKLPSRKQRERFTTISGRTDTGARVQVNDIPAPVDHKGRFRVRVPLKKGRNKIVVVTEDVAGNVKTRRLPDVTVDDNVPIESLDIRWGKEDQPG